MRLSDFVYNNEQILYLYTKQSRAKRYVGTDFLTLYPLINEAIS